LVLVLRSRVIRIILLAVPALLFIIFCLCPGVVPVLASRSQLERELKAIFIARAMGLMNGNYEGLEAYYDTGCTSGRFALNHEIGRIKHVQEWLKHRRVELTGIKLDLAVVDAGKKGEKGWASVSQHMILGYRHEGEPEETVNQLGVRTLHWVELENTGDKWLIKREWYWDPFENDSLNPEVAPGTARCDATVGPPPPGKYNREAAVRYADRYSGVRHGPGDGRYNQAYRDFTGVGGDCANFASQVLSDRNAGAIPLGWTWNYHDGNGSQAWTQAEALVDYLLYSGLAEKIMRGSFTEVTAHSERYPHGAVNALHPGDIIGYEENGEIVHVSVVVGRDSAGYVLVNSHTADRYHVPWDMGWEKRTVYWLLHIVY